MIDLVSEEERLQLSRYAQIHIDTAKQSFGIDLDYSEASILRLYEIIEQGWSDQPPAALDQMILLFGSFLGEAMCQLFGGAWVRNDDGAIGVRVGEATIMVFTKMKKRFLNGPEDSISYYYQGVKTMLSTNNIIIP